MLIGSHTCMPHRLAQQRMTLNDLECLNSTASASRDISVVSELLVFVLISNYCRYKVKQLQTRLYMLITRMAYTCSEARAQLDSKAQTRAYMRRQLAVCTPKFI